MAAGRGEAMVVRVTGKRSNLRTRGRKQARRGSGSDDTSDEDYRLEADGEDEVSTEDEAAELELSDEEDGRDQEDEDEETSSSDGESELEDEDDDDDFVLNSVKKRKKTKKSKPKPKQVKRKRKRAKAPAKKKKRSGVARVCDEEEESKPRRRVKARRRFGGEDDDEEVEDRDDVDFSPDDEEEEDDFDEEELEDEGEDDDEDLEEDDEEQEEDYESNDEEDDVFVEIRVRRNNASRKGSGKKQKGRKRKRKPNSKRANFGAKKRKRTTPTKPATKKRRRRRRTISTSDEDEEDEDFVIEDGYDDVDDDYELIDEEDDDDDIRPVRKRKTNRSSDGNTRTRRRLAIDNDSPTGGSYSSDFDDTVPEKEEGEGRILAVVKRPRTGGVLDRSKQEEKGKEKATDQEQDPLEKRICGVCLSEERKGHVVGLLNSCSHFFCFACILEWSKVESRCPVCKQRFNTVTKASGSDLTIQLRPIVVRVPKRDQVYQPSEEEVRGYLDPYANVVCIECLQGGEDTLMLLCDLCNSAAHTYCVGLGREVPEGDWYCDACRSADYEQANMQDQEAQNQQVVNATELQPSQHNANRNGRLEIDMNLPYVPSPERPDIVADESFFGTADLNQPTQVHLHEDAGRASRSARQSASTVSERRALHQRIHSIFSNNWSRTVPGAPYQVPSPNTNQFRGPAATEERQQSVLFNDFDPFTPNPFED